MERKNFLVEPTEGDDPPLLPEEDAGPTLRSAFPEKKIYLQTLSSHFI